MNNIHEAVIENMDFPVIVVSGEIDDLGRIISVNEAGARVHGYKKEELIDRSLMVLEDEKEFEKVRDAAEKIFSGEKIDISVIHRKKDGSELFLHSTAKMFLHNKKKNILIISDVMI